MDERRYYGLDALRGVAMLLGIVLHAAMFYTASEVIPLADRQRSHLFDAAVLFIHSFRMPLFFLLSGFFGALLVEKYGMRRAYWNRVKRVFVPFLIGVVTVVPLAAWPALSFGVSAEAGRRLFFTASPEQLEWAERMGSKLYAEKGRLPAPAHLWFLYYLMIFYLFLPLCSGAKRLLERSHRAARVERWVASPWFPLAPALWTAATLWPYQGAFVGLTYLRPQLTSLLYYGTFFVLGHLFHDFRGFLSTSERHLRAYAVAASILFVASLGPSIVDFRQRGADLGLHALTVCLNGLLTWSLIYAFVGLFQRFLDRDSPWVAYVSQSSYWVYLVHLPIACFAAWWIVGAEWPAILKFAFVAGVTTLVGFTSYHYLVRRTWISVLLNGRRFSLRWPWLEPSGRAYSLPMSPEGGPVGEARLAR
jgi:glucans biosynthesis protein C